MKPEELQKIIDGALATERMRIVSVMANAIAYVVEGKKEDEISHEKMMIYIEAADRALRQGIEEPNRERHPDWAYPEYPPGT